ncbi:MAG: AtpZ/AtpI family protein [Anaerolineales bacterium]|nr:AtpZ/AtpI family protein [Anaerolineales bacterium]
MESLDNPDPNGGSEPSEKREARQLQVLWREALRAMSLGWDLAIPIFGGVLLGNMLDRWLGTGHIFTLGLLMLGVMTAYYNLGRVIQRLRKADRARDNQRKKEKEEHE